MAREFDLLLHRAEIEVMPFTADHLRLALDVYERCGKGRHPAQLNLDGCCACALHGRISAIQGKRLPAHGRHSRTRLSPRISFISSMTLLNGKIAEIRENSPQSEQSSTRVISDSSGCDADLEIWAVSLESP